MDGQFVLDLTKLIDVTKFPTDKDERDNHNSLS